MFQRYLTSFEALQVGLRERDEEALRASVQLLATAHDRSRSQIVVFVGSLPLANSEPILRRWLAEDWPAQSAAWWVLGYLERLAPPAATELRKRLSPLDRFADIEHEMVALQAASWLYCHALVPTNIAAKLPTQVELKLRHWLNATSVALALAALQALLRLDVDVSKSEAARVIAQASNRGLREADVLGMRCGFIECAEKLVDEMIADGPWASVAVDALAEVLPDEARARLETMRPKRWTSSDSAIHVMTVLAAHHDVKALQWLERACAQRDPRRRALAWAGRVKAVCKAGDIGERQAVGKALLREDEAIRAWVISGLDPSCPTQREWLNQARRYGTLEEQEAVVDAMRAFSLRGPLVPDGLNASSADASSR